MDIICEVMDKEFGVVFIICIDIYGLVLMFGLGSYCYSVMVIDVVGNIGIGVIIFIVVVLLGDVNFDGVIDCGD